MQSKSAGDVAYRYRLKGARVLLVDDCADFTLLMQHFLKRLEVELDVAADAAEGLQLASAKSYDLMLVDIVLPNLDGCEFTRHVRAAGYKRPILILSAHVFGRKPGEIEAAGADAFFAKPVDLSHLAAEIAMRL